MRQILLDENIPQCILSKHNNRLNCNAKKQPKEILTIVIVSMSNSCRAILRTSSLNALYTTSTLQTSSITTIFTKSIAPECLWNETETSWNSLNDSLFPSQFFCRQSCEDCWFCTYRCISPGHERRFHSFIVPIVPVVPVVPFMPLHSCCSPYCVPLCHWLLTPGLNEDTWNGRGLLTTCIHTRISFLRNRYSNHTK